MELLKALVIKVLEAYGKLFKTWTRFVIFFACYFLATSFLPNKIANIIVWLVLAFLLIGIFGSGLRKKGPKN